MEASASEDTMLGVEVRRTGSVDCIYLGVGCVDAAVGANVVAQRKA